MVKRGAIKHLFFKSPYFGEKIMADIFAAVDMSTALTFVVGLGVIAVGIALAFKGTGLSKRGIKQA
jgi:hypothetical protein